MENRAPSPPVRLHTMAHMGIILTGMLGSLLDRLGATEGEPLSQFRCGQILDDAYP